MPRLALLALALLLVVQLSSLGEAFLFSRRLPARILHGSSKAQPGSGSAKPALGLFGYVRACLSVKRLAGDWTCPPALLL